MFNTKEWKFVDTKQETYQKPPKQIEERVIDTDESFVWDGNATSNETVNIEISSMSFPHTSRSDSISLPTSPSTIPLSQPAMGYQPTSTPHLSMISPQSMRHRSTSLTHGRGIQKQRSQPKQSHLPLSPTGSMNTNTVRSWMATNSTPNPSISAGTPPLGTYTTQTKKHRVRSQSDMQSNRISAHMNPNSQMVRQHLIVPDPRRGMNHNTMETSVFGTLSSVGSLSAFCDVSSSSVRTTNPFNFLDNEKPVNHALSSPNLLMYPPPSLQ